MTLEVFDVSPAIGAEVSGLDLSEPLADELVEELRGLFLDRMVLVFRDQNLNREQHKRFASCFGGLHVHPSKRNGMSETDPELFIIDTPADAKWTNGETWHSDVSCERVPPLASLLYVSKVPENGGGDTLFANMYEAYASLSPDLKTYLSNRRAFHDGEKDLRQYGIKLRAGQEYPSSSHPVVVGHPETGKPVLFVNESFTSHIEGIPSWESQMILDGLNRYVAANQRIQCRVKWTANTLVMWDNRCVQHQAIRDYAGYARYAERVSVVDPDGVPVAHSG